MASPGRDNWLDRELRNVPLPEGMVARLKEIGTSTDAQFDALLRDVPMPEGLLDRLKVSARDFELEEQLAAVPVPKGLLARLHEIPQLVAAESEDTTVAPPLAAEPPVLIEALSDTHSPAGTLVLTKPAGTSTKRWIRSSAPWALAAGVLVAIGLLSMTNNPGPGPVAQRAEPAPAQSNTIKEQGGTGGDPELAHETLEPADARLPWAPKPLLSGRDPIEVFRDDLTAPDGQDSAQPTSPSETALLSTALGENLSEVDQVVAVRPRGIAPPAVPQFDLLRLLRDSTHPFVAPGLHAELQLSRVPLVTDRESYRQAWRAIAAGRLPAPEEIRVEDFLAAMHYGFPDPTGHSLGLHTATGPAPFSERGTSLLHVGAQARKLGLPARPATHLTIAFDYPASAGHGRPLDALGEALVGLLAELGPQDRLSLVSMRPAAEVLLPDFGRGDEAALAAALKEVGTGHSATLTEGLQIALKTSRATKLHQRRIIWVTAGLQETRQPVLNEIEALVRAAAEEGVRLEIIDLRQGEQNDPRFVQLARAGQGAVYQQADGQAIRYQLLEILGGRSTRMASSSRLVVRFDPATVAHYRLLGHESNSVGGLVSSPLEMDLRSGQAATALYEVKLKPGAGGDVAVVTLIWQDPETKVKHHLSRRITRDQFVASFSRSAVALQRAALAAEAAEVLRNSPYATPPTKGLPRILALAAKLPPAVRVDASVVSLLELVERADRIRAGQPVDLPAPLFWQFSRP